MPAPSSASRITGRWRLAPLARATLIAAGYTLVTLLVALLLTRLAATLPLSAALQPHVAGLAGMLLLCGAVLAVLGVTGSLQLAAVRGHQLSHAGAWLAWPVGVLLASLAVVAARLLAGPPPAHTNPEVTHTSIAALVGLLVATMPLVAIAEELTFRGVVLGLLVRGWGTTKRGVYRAVTASSLLYGVPHLIHLSVPLGARMVQVLMAAGMGWVLAGVRLRSGSIWPGVLLHALYNLTVSLAALPTPSARLPLPLIVVVLAITYGTSLINASLTHAEQPRQGQAEAGDAVGHRSAR